MMDIQGAVERAVAQAESGHWDASLAWSNVANAIATNRRYVIADEVATLALRFFTEPDDGVFQELNNLLSVYETILKA